MTLLSPPVYPRELKKLVTEFNTIPADNHIHRLFHLQKINYILNKTPMTPSLFNWINDPSDEGLQKHLMDYSINPNASFFCKGMQFAQAVALQTENKPALDGIKNEYPEYPLMEQRDDLLKSDLKELDDPIHTALITQYIKVSCQLNHLANTDDRIKTILQKHISILKSAETKLEKIQGKVGTKSAETPYYSTQPLGEKQVNNFNYKFSMSDVEESFVFRVEDRSQLNLEQELHSHEVSKYFIEDFAVFMMQFKTLDNEIEYKPVVLSQFANQGNLGEVAKQLRKESKTNIGPKTAYYFTQLSEFCSLLMATNTYHPDIKLTNFLVHNNRLLISDRKTLLSDENTQVSKIRTTPGYAPEELLECLNRQMNGYQPKLSKRIINMPQFMSYQLGMALKEFLILTQVDELPEDFRDSNRDAASYFESPSKQILNLSLLVQELTREDANKRLSIKQFKSLLIEHRNKNPNDFYAEVEKTLPNSVLGIEDDIKFINSLIAENLHGVDLLNQANPFFKKIIDSSPKESRLVRLSEKLAIKCYKQSSKDFFAQISATIETELLNKDWQQAPWYRQALHFVSLGYFRVDRVSKVSDITLPNLKTEEFQNHIHQLEFLTPLELIKDLGKLETSHLSEFVYRHLHEIVPQDKKPVKQKSPVVEEDSDVAPLLKQSNKAPSGTIVILEPSNTPVSEVSADILTDKKPRPVSTDESTANSRDGFFNSARPGSIRSSMLRGDRHQGRSHLSEINWTPPVTP